MRLSLLTLVALAAPLAAQEAQEVAPGLTIVGHGPDVPNVSSTPTCDVGQAVCGGQQAAPVFIVIVPVPIFVGRSDHHRPVAIPAAAVVPNQAAGRFVNDPSNRFINDPSNRFVNDPSNRFTNSPVPHNR